MVVNKGLAYEAKASTIARMLAESKEFILL
jgi:hypothetical protein